MNRLYWIIPPVIMVILMIAAVTTPILGGAVLEPCKENGKPLLPTSGN